MGHILVNDGLHPTGIKLLQDAGHNVVTEKVDQADLVNQLSKYDGICVRSATKIRKEQIDASNMKFIGRGGVGLDNIDVDYAKGKGIAVLNTPAASSRSVAELVFAHMLSISRFLYKSNKHMHTEGMSDFKVLKKSYSKGIELEGKKIGIIGFGRIGQEVAKIALGMGMEVLAVDKSGISEFTIINKIGRQSIETIVTPITLEEMLPQADYITIHVPGSSTTIAAAEMNLMKDGVILINAARGGVVDEDDLLAAINSEKIAAAGLDVFINEPTPNLAILEHPSISMTPHIGASTSEAQEKIGIELAEQIINVLG